MDYHKAISNLVKRVEALEAIVGANIDTVKTESPKPTPSPSASAKKVNAPQPTPSAT